MDAIQAIKSAADKVKSNPLAYRAGKRGGTHEMVMDRFPYVLIYRVLPNRISILRVLHQAMKYFN